MDRDVPPGTTQMKDSDVPRHRTAAVRMPSDRAVEAAPPNSPLCRRSAHNRSGIVDRCTGRRCCAAADRRSSALTSDDTQVFYVEVRQAMNVRVACGCGAFPPGCGRGASGHSVLMRRPRAGDRIDRRRSEWLFAGVRQRRHSWGVRADNRADHGCDAIASRGADGLDGVEQARKANAVGEVRRDDGVATVFACLALAALIGATLLIAQVGSVVVARHRAQAAADLAALAAAGELARGADVGCAEGAEIARRMGVRIQQCEVVQWDVIVTVEGNVPMGLLGKRTVRAVARAGPVEVGA
uniref:Rv3654c family TadE-like protein n=1 Tax=Nocardia pseudovaccinii TaxID=189540 RepID=UPI0035A2499D